MSNSYGFDFLRSEHLDPTAQQHKGGAPEDDGIGHHHEESESTMRVEDKSDLEKQYDIVAFLQAHRGSGCLAPNVIYRATGIDLDSEPSLNEMLQRNPKVKTEMVPDPENPELMVPTYAYQAKYSNVRDRTTLLAQINRMTSGVPMRDLLDSYNSVKEDILALITAGDVIAIANNEDKDKIIFPRGDSFLVELDGIISVPATNGHSSTPNGINGVNGHHPPPEVYVVDTDVDPQPQIRRGEAVQVGGQWFRVSSAVRQGSLEDQPARAQAPLSVVSKEEMSKRNLVDGYIRPMTAKCLPLDAALSSTALGHLENARRARETFKSVASQAAHAGGRGSGGGGAAAMVNQLLGANANHCNPTTIASQFAATARATSHIHHHAAASTLSASSGNHPSSRKRPNPGTAKSGAGTAVPPLMDATTSALSLSKEELEKVAGDPIMATYSRARRHGCTTDVREMYMATRDLVPESDVDLHHELLKHKLVDPGEELRRKRLTKQKNVDNDGKPKKRRYYTNKNQRMTNTHLEGTDIGAILARAADLQKQGKKVGDGGM